MRCKSDLAFYCCLFMAFATVRDVITRTRETSTKFGYVVHETMLGLLG